LNKHNINITRGRLPEKADAQRAGRPKKKKKTTYKPTNTVTLCYRTGFHQLFLVAELMRDCRWSRDFHHYTAQLSGRMQNERAHVL